MAEEQAKAGEGTEEPKKKSKKILFIILGAILLLIILWGAAILLLGAGGFFAYKQFLAPKPIRPSRLPSTRQICLKRWAKLSPSSLLWSIWPTRKETAT